MDEAGFPGWMQRVRSGEPAAAAEFVARYEPLIRRAIRVRGTGGRLQRVVDSEDLCQTVMRRFFENAGDGNVLADNPTTLLNWLLEVARNRLREQHRHARAAKRGGGRLARSIRPPLTGSRVTNPTSRQEPWTRSCWRGCWSG